MAGIGPGRGVTAIGSPRELTGVTLPAHDIYVKSASKLAEACGLDMSPRRRKAAIAVAKGWIAAVGFPRKRSKKGWRISEVNEWRLQTAKLVDGDIAESESQNPELPIVFSQADLAARLMAHFKGRIEIEINEMTITRWKRGNHLPPGAPLPPPRVGPKMNSKAWADWIEKWILPKHGIEAKKDNVYARADESAARTKILSEKIKEEEWKSVSDRYIELALVQRMGSAWARRYHDFWKNRNEKVEPVEFERYAASIGVPAGQVTALRAWLTDRCRLFLDLVEQKAAAAAAEWSEELKKRE